MIYLIKRIVPKTLFARAVLIVALPTILAQMVAAYVFFDRHWDNVSRHMGGALAGEIALLVYQSTRVDEEGREPLFWVFHETTGVNAQFEKDAKLDTQPMEEVRDFELFHEALAQRIDLPFTITRLDAEERVEIRIQQSGGVLKFQANLKRLESRTTLIFVLWMLGSSLVFLGIAGVFLRNQVRPIKQLAEAAESFGKGRDIADDFKPHGAQEVRRAARAFLVMRDRIIRQIRSRTEMLAGISHDLRTPLTRMKLQLAMLPGTQETEELQSDVAQMERMITEYLEFARGEGGEESVMISLSDALQSIVEDYARSGKTVPLTVPKSVKLELREMAFRRMMHNLIDNALRYGHECAISTHVVPGRLEIYVDDKGQGIDPAHREQVFRPFTRLDASRNLNAGGVGLGLTIARDVARAHGGNILLSEAKGGGLRVIIRLPI